MTIKIIHIMPEWEHHDSCVECWCNPYLKYKDPENDGEIWMHRRGDI